MQDTINYQGNTYRVVNQSFFVYVFTFNDASIAPAATILDSITIENDAFFLLQEINAVVSNSGLTDIVSTPLATLQIQDTGTGRNMFQRPVSLLSVTGNGSLPFIMPVSTLFKQLSTLQATVVNYDAAETYGRIQIALIGSKVFVAG